MPKRTQKYTKKNKKTHNKKRPIKHRKTAKQHKRRKSHKQRGGDRPPPGAYEIDSAKLALYTTKEQIRNFIQEIPLHVRTEPLRVTIETHARNLTDPLDEHEIHDLFRGWVIFLNHHHPADHKSTEFIHSILCLDFSALVWSSNPAKR